MTQAFATAEIAATHRDRPTAKTILPFVIEGVPNAGRASSRLVYQHEVQPIGMPKKFVPMSVQMDHPIAISIMALQSMYYEVEAERDGHLKQIDDLTTENVLLKRQIEETANKAKHAERKASK